MKLPKEVILPSALLCALILPRLSPAQAPDSGNSQITPPAEVLATQSSEPKPTTPAANRGAARRAANAVPATMHERFANFVTEGGFESYLVLQNLRLDAPVTVTPVLLLRQGEIPLDTINMPPHTTTTIDINDALKAHNLSEPRGIVAARYSFNTYGALSAVVESTDQRHRVFLTSVGQSPEEFWYGTTLDAVLWAPEEGTEGFISMINTSSEAKKVQIRFLVNGREDETQEVEINSRQQRILRIDSLVKRSREAGAAIRLAFAGKPGDIVAEGALLKKQTGFSKYIHFADTALHFPSNTLRTNFLLLGRQPLVDGFPAQTSFRSVAVLRNVDPVAIQVTPLVRRLSGGPAIGLKPLALAPGETRLIDFTREQEAGNLPPDLNQGTLQLVPDTDHNSVIAELLNFDEASRSYVVGSSFSAHPSRVTGSLWRIDGSFQTTVVVENTSTQADQVTLKLFSDDGGAYEKIFPIAAGSILKINIKELQQSRIPDNSGKFLLATTGTLSLSGANGAHSALSFDKLVHSADESEYIGLLANPCVYVSGISLFLDSTPDPYFFLAFIDAFWTDGSISEEEAYNLISSSPSLASVSGNAVTLHPADSSSHNVTLSTQVLETACDICSSDYFFGSTQVTVPPKPACPTTVTLSGTTTLSLASQFPGLKTGIGIVASMQTNPTNINWNGTAIVEALTQSSNNCPASFGSQCTGSSTFTVGQGGSTFGQNFAATQNIFYDQHASTSTVSALDNAGINSCQVTCSQTYSCGGHAIGTFTINRSFTKGTIQNTPVTDVTVTKQ